MAAFSPTASPLVPLVAFWISGAMLAYTFIGYGALMALLGSRRQMKRGALAAPPDVCAVIVAYNEEARIVTRLENLLSSDYPHQKLRVLLVSDGSTDRTVVRAQALDPARVTVLAQPIRAGKAAGLNAALVQATGEIVVFTDARQHFAPDAIARLAAHFADPQIGAVSGALEIAPAASAPGAGVDTYWRYEKFLRAAESRVDSCIGCTGAIYAIPRKLFTPIPADTLLDDVVIPMQIAQQGRRIVHDPEACAFDPQPLDTATERRRKQRTIAGNFQMLFRHPEWLLPWRHRLWWQLFSHKYLRLFAPLFLLTIFLASARLVSRPFYTACFAGQLLFYLLAFLGGTGPRPRWLALPAAFVFLNLMTLLGLRYYLAPKSRAGWE